MNDSKPILSVSDVAKMLGVSSNTIYSMARSNEIPHFKIRARILFEREILEKWINEESMKSMQIVSGGV